MNTPIYLKWFPPSWIQIKAGDRIIYIDPAYLKTNFVHYPKKIEYSKWPDPIDGLPEELEKGHIVLITHHHKDHCKGVTVRRLKNEETKIFATGQCYRELGKDITVVKPGVEMEIDNIRIKTVEAYNERHEGQAKLMHKKGIGVGYLISLEGRTIYHAGDTDLIPEMEYINHVDLAFLPIGGRSFTMGLTQALEAAKRIKPKVIIPTHRFDTDPELYKKLVENEASIKVEVLDIGETYQLL